MDGLVSKWIQKSKNAGGIYKFEYNISDNYRFRGNVWLRPDYSADLAKRTSEIGYRGVITLYLPMDNWWRSCFNHWFFAKACWDPEFDVKEGLKDYCRKYYGEEAEEIEAVFTEIFSNLHPEPYRSLHNDFRPEDLEKGISSFSDPDGSVKKTASELSERLKRISEKTDKPEIKKQIERLIVYIEFHQLYIETFSNWKEGDLSKLMSYINNHPNLGMVLMFPEYIARRNRHIFKLE
jgi:hypothetical protein